MRIFVGEGSRYPSENAMSAPRKRLASSLRAKAMVLFSAAATPA